MYYQLIVICYYNIFKVPFKVNLFFNYIIINFISINKFNISYLVCLGIFNFKNKYTFHNQNTLPTKLS